MTLAYALIRRSYGSTPVGLTVISAGYRNPPARSITLWTGRQRSSVPYAQPVPGTYSGRPRTEPRLKLGFHLFASSAPEPATAGLEKWRDAVARVPPNAVLPMGFGGRSEANTAAWYGDKTLGTAISKELRNRIDDSCTPGSLSVIYSAAASNETMAAHLELLLPGCLLDCIPPPQSAALQIHDCGTMVEACVDAIAAENPEAVAELARFLVNSVTDTNSSPSEESDSIDEMGTPDSSPVQDSGEMLLLEKNPKGRLLELGGQVKGTRIGGFAHAPVWQAEATLEEHTAEATGPSKKSAERDAAAAVLAQAGMTSLVQPTKRINLATEKASDSEVQDLDDRQNTIEDSEVCRWTNILGLAPEANLKQGETLVEWFKRKATIHRCITSPRIFPDIIRSVRG